MTRQSAILTTAAIVGFGWLLSACNDVNCHDGQLRIANECYDKRATDASTVDPPSGFGCDGGGCGDAGRPASTFDASVRPNPAECDQRRPCSNGFECRTGRCLFVPDQREPAAATHGGGGGRASSANYQLQWSLGGSQPAGRTSSHRYTMTLGPTRPPSNAVRNERK